jgi:large subunit ribosomal protein L13
MVTWFSGKENHTTRSLSGERNCEIALDQFFATQAILNLSFAGKHLPAARFLRCALRALTMVPWEQVTMSTYFPSSHDITRKWFVVDASGKTLGRLATEAASTLSGKKNPKYTPFIDMGDHVIVVNAEKIRLTGLKSQQKVYRRYTGFPGGLREESFVRLMARRPEKIVEEAIKGMLPKSKMGRQMATKLKVYRGDKHPHQAQQPEVLEFAAR